MLRELDLSHNGLSSFTLDSHTFLPHLTRLDLSNNMLTSVGQLDTLISLRTLDLSFNRYRNCYIAQLLF